MDRSAMSPATNARSTVPVSVIVPVKNEGHQLARCLESVQWADEIIVIDSHSSDDTVAVSERCGARVVQFLQKGTWPKKKNWALENVPLRHDWVLLLDADEVLPTDADAEIARLVTNTSSSVRGYWINRRFFFMGRWLRHSYYPNWNLRLFQHRFGRFERLTSEDTESGDVEVHEHVVIDGETARMRTELDHYAFPTITNFVEKHNRYSNWEAHVTLEAAMGNGYRPQSGRARLKAWTRRLPCRPLLRFLYLYVWQCGFLDGREGYYFARLHALYEFLSVTKTFELRKRRGGQL
jgi:glycosyltransferase involved in cell wall biosynthesis